MGDKPSKEDSKLFRQVIQGVKPLKESNKIITRPNPVSKEVHHTSLSHKKQQNLELFPLTDTHTLRYDAEEILSYKQTGLSSKQWQRLRGGYHSIEATLDLHGLTKEHARNALNEFILKCLKNHFRHVLIIHGKGGKTYEKPVLKNQVAHWLKQSPYILAFHSAKGRDGGTGAIYLLFKSHGLS